MTVAAVILASSAESALADADGLPSVRRIADSAWSGGATPIVVVSADPAGAVASALAGAPVTLAEPAPADGAAAQMVRGIEVAVAEVREASGALVWPAAMTWVGPETITSLIEAHGADRDAIVAPRFGTGRGWPVLVPVTALATLRSATPAAQPGDIVDALLRERAGSGRPDLVVDLGDPGVAHDRSTARVDLPPYVGPSGPPAGHVHEWGAALADLPDDAPLEGPTLAPYAPAAAGDVEG